MEKSSVTTHILSTSRELFRHLEFLNNQFLSLSSIINCRALLELDTYKVMTVKRLACMLNLEKHTASRLAIQLVEDGLCRMRSHKDDRRNKLLTLTPQGLELVKKIHTHYQLYLQQALSLARTQEKETILQGLSLYTQLLHNARLQEACVIRKLIKKDIPYLLNLSKLIRREHGIERTHPLWPVIDAEEKEVIKTYTMPRSNHFVIVHDTEIVGGGGYCPLSQDHKYICAIKGLYLTPNIRRLGLGRQLLEALLRSAKQHGFQHCCVEVFEFPQNPSSFYENLGFKRLEKPLVKTGTRIANQWFIKEL